MTDPLDQPIYTVPQVAEWLQCSANQVTMIATRDDWPRLKFGNRIRFTATHLQQIITRLEAAPATKQPRQKVGTRSRSKT